MKEREELEEELQIYKERLEDAMETGNLAWWEMELPSGEIQFNDRKAEMLGYPPEKFEHYTDFTDIIHPEDHDRAMKAMKDHLEGKEKRYEVEYRIEKDNGEYKWFRDVGSITEEEGEYKKVTGIVIDIDERKRIQEHEKFLHSLLRHDLRNKIQLIQGYLDLLDMNYELPEEAGGYVKKAKKGVKTSVDLIEKVRTLIRASDEKRKKVRLETSIRDAVEANEDRMEENDMEIEIKDQDKSFYVRAGPLLKEVFSNLIENAIKYSGGDEIRVSRKEVDGKIICSIEDDGEGIPDEKKEKIFNRGFTTNEERGTGLGLYLLRDLVETYGGGVEVEGSELGGARFDVYLEKGD
ncbi:MAG: PAS domain-containing sensor histidine kinase [Candidatus Thermoplasmatota archaeon]|nr:PAS domain-containing sensor histidine kinase [Candidatus Thermoplasmatota archaeon]